MDIDERARKIAERMWSVRYINPRTVEEVVGIIGDALRAVQEEALREELGKAGEWHKREFCDGRYKAGLLRAAEIVQAECICPEPKGFEREYQQMSAEQCKFDYAVKRIRKEAGEL